MDSKLDKKTIKDGYTKLERDERYISQEEKYMRGFDGLLDEDVDEFGDKTVHGFLGRRRG